MPFPKGQSGNPAGRKRGSRNKATALRDQLEADASALIRKLVKLAKAGDVDALKFLVGRLIPPARELPVTVNARGTLRQQGEAIIADALNGRLTPAEAHALVAALASQAKLAEVTDLETRLAALEQRHEAKIEEARNGHWR